MTEFSRKWLPRFAWIVLIVVLVQSIRMDERLLKPIANGIVNVLSWFNDATVVKDKVKREVEKSTK